MSNFSVWLHNQPNSDDPGLKALQDFAANNIKTWPYWADDSKEYLAAITKINPGNVEEIKESLIRKHELWKSKSQETPSKFGWLKENVSGVGLISFGAIIAAVMIVGLFRSEFYGTLARTDQTRGLITFLFVLATSGIILLIAIAIFWMKNEDNIKDRFAYAKDLLTIVIGVLGTILGFYFGLQTTDMPVGVANIAVSHPVAKKGDKVSIRAQIVGGRAPYNVIIEFSDPLGAIDKITTLRNDANSGAISQEVEIPNVTQDGAILFKITATDLRSIQGQGTGSLFVKK